MSNVSTRPSHTKYQNKILFVRESVYIIITSIVGNDGKQTVYSIWSHIICHMLGVIQMRSVVLLSTTFYPENSGRKFTSLTPSRRTGHYSSTLNLGQDRQRSSLRGKVKRENLG